MINPEALWWTHWTVTEECNGTKVCSYDYCEKVQSMKYNSLSLQYISKELKVETYRQQHIM